ncbi:MAG: response regulator transcription factor [Nocardioidaceae bacterium]|nr:response regulator transcription factor [Nocardioidaceae bacterium]NUS49932.1 response regulator transcription factor [Nocardioidaceae bacterium]
MSMVTAADATEQAVEVIRVLVVDDHPTVHMGLATVLTAAQGVEMVAAETSGADGVAAYPRVRPDVVLLDLTMPDQSGHVTLQQLLAQDPDARVLVLTASASSADVSEALGAGAAGYVLKDVDGPGLRAAIRAVRRGEVPVDARVTRALLRETPGAETPPSAMHLTQREYDVLRLLRDGLSNQQIGQRLGIRQNTVKTHLRNAFAHIGVTDRTAAALWAYRHLGEVKVG